MIVLRNWGVAQDSGYLIKPEMVDFIVFRGSSIPGTGNRDWILDTEF